MSTVAKRRRRMVTSINASSLVAEIYPFFLPKLAANNGSFTAVNALAMYFMRQEVQLMLRTLVITTCTADTGYIISVCSYSVTEQTGRCAMASRQLLCDIKTSVNTIHKKTSHDSIKSRTHCRVESYPVCCFATQ